MRILVCAGVCAIVVAAGAVPALAQNTTGGIKAGVTSSTLSATGVPGFDPSPDAGIVAGGWLTFGGKVARLQTEVLWTTRRFSSPSPIGTLEISSRGIEVPVLVVARWRPDARVHPTLLAGPYLAFISKATQTVGTTTTDLDSQLKGIDAGIVVGLGLDIDAKRGGIVIEARYDLGLRNVSETSGTTFKSRAFLATFGYRF